MTKQLKEIEIPLGAKDSELCGWEYTIPEGMEATIVDNKIVVKKKESEDERIRKGIFKALSKRDARDILISQGIEVSDALAWLEKQGEQKFADKVEQNPAWSEEDEINYNYALAACKYYGEAKGYADTETHQKTNNWLKSIKYRYFWKPSDEQINGIECTIKTLHHQLNVGDGRLDSLYHDLKKLRG